MDATLAEVVRRRAATRCEYCQLPEAASCVPFEIDHIISKKHRGPTSGENLALTCFYCNSHKGPNIAGVDPESGALSRLYHPRTDRWDDHFRWNRPVLLGITAVGRATIEVLCINAPDFVALRASLIREGLFPGIARTAGPFGSIS